MTVDADELTVSFAQFGERCHGILLIRGQRWPRDKAAWTCEHRHEGPMAAEACASAELARRKQRS